MTNYPKRLIEVDLPIARISAHARREKSIRHGHISTLHIWWARRPLAACRAVICASLWPDPADELCPQAFREAAVVILREFAKRAAPSYVPQSEGGASISDETRKIEAGLSAESRARWEALAAGTLTLDPAEPADMAILRMALLDFIADFANWDNSTVPAYLETARRLTGVAHASLSEATFQLPMSFAELSQHLAKEAKAKAKGSKVGSGGVCDWMDALEKQLGDLPRPLVVDPFAGGGSIPLEAMRVGANAFASDLNPIPVLLNKVVLEYIPKYGMRLADEVRKWGGWIKAEAELELAEFYPKDPDGAVPIAYLWARTIQCDGPACGAEVPLIRSLWLAKKANRSIAIRLSPIVPDKRVDIALFAKQGDEWVSFADANVRVPAKMFSGEGTMKRGSATCPCCGYTTPVARVREQLRERRGGARTARLLAVIVSHPNESGRRYRIATSADTVAVSRAAAKLSTAAQEDGKVHVSVPTEEFSGLEPRRIPLPQYGMNGFGDLFGARQSLTLITFARLIRRMREELDKEDDPGLSEAVMTLLAFVVDRLADKLSSIARWDSTRENPQGTFARQALPMVWDFSEVCPFSGGGGDWDTALSWVAHVVERESLANHSQGSQAAQASATSQALPSDSANALITDPPYYYSVPYSDLSDFFYVWLKRGLAMVHPELFSTDVTPKDQECVQNLAHSAVAHRQKDRQFYERTMAAAFEDSRRVLMPNGIAVVVFAHTDTEAWEALVNALVAAGWCVTASWPIDTEMANRVLASRQSTLASSVHLVCRPREDASGTVTQSVGEWRDVLGELPKRIHEWMPRLAAEGVVGADAIFACLGPALEVFSRYSRVEKANGDAATLREYLEFVWAAVSTEAMSLIFKDADAAGLEPDARLTAMWLWTLGGGNSAGEQVGDGAEETDDSGDDEDTGGKVAKLSGFTLEYDAARKIAQGLGVHLEQCQTLVEVKGDKARMLPVKERAESLFGKSGSATATQAGGKAAKKKAKQKSLFEEMVAEEPSSNSATWGDLQGPTAGSTVLDRVHQSMILFAAGRGEMLKRFLVEDGIGKDARFWKLAQSLSALYPKECEEKRWVDGVLARKKGLGL
jgi:adenine-specific DNA methylase